MCISKIYCLDHNWILPVTWPFSFKLRPSCTGPPFQNPELHTEKQGILQSNTNMIKLSTTLKSICRLKMSSKIINSILEVFIVQARSNLKSKIFRIPSLKVCRFAKYIVYRQCEMVFTFFENVESNEFTFHSLGLQFVYHSSYS